MFCIFCNKVVQSNSEQQSLQDSLYVFFCCRLGIEDPPISSLDKLLSCDECYTVYNELKNLLLKLEDLKSQINQYVGELKNRVISSSRECGTDNEADSHLAIFRNKIIQTNLSEFLGTPSGVNNKILKSEPHEVKVEPQDLDFESIDGELDNTSSEFNLFHEFEIQPDNYQIGNTKEFDTPNSSPDSDYMDSKDQPHSSPDSECTRKMLTRRKNLNRGSKNVRIRNTKRKKNTPQRNSSTSIPSRLKKNEKISLNTAVTVKTKSPHDSRLKSKPSRRLVFSSDESDNDSEEEDAGKIKSDNNNKIPCQICHKFFPKRSRLIRHQMIVHEKQKNYICPYCSKKFARNHIFIMHVIKTHETLDKPLKCAICEKKFTTQILLERHQNFHKLDETKPLACEVCDIRFAENDKSGLERHVQYTHTRRPNTFKCAPCKLSFQNRNLLLKHDNLAHPEKFNLECQLCDKRYSVKEFLETHMKTHSEGPFQCSVCKWEVLTAELLSEHLLSHTGEKRVKCDDCGDRFFSMAELKRHRVNLHGVEKNFECKFCSKRFILNSDMTAHIREVHTGFPNQFSCIHCGKGFTNQKYMKTHIKKIHELKKIVYCEVCGKRLADTSSLKDHMNSHEGIKPFQCSYCGQRFVKKNTLKCHILTHTGEKPFKCSKCSKAFTQSHCLKTHLKSHANDSAKGPDLPSSSSTGATTGETQVYNTNNVTFSMYPQPNQSLYMN